MSNGILLELAVSEDTETTFYGELYFKKRLLLKKCRRKIISILLSVYHLILPNIKEAISGNASHIMQAVDLKGLQGILG